jgi:hypothetical protein
VANKGAVRKICRRGPNKITESGAINIARHSTFNLVPRSNGPNHLHDIKSPKRFEELGKQVEEVNLSNSIVIFHEEEEPLEEINLSSSFANFDDNSTYHVLDKSPENKAFDLSVTPINYVDFIGVDAILSNSSNQICDEIYMAEGNVLSKGEAPYDHLQELERKKLSILSLRVFKIFQTFHTF